MAAEPLRAVPGTVGGGGEDMFGCDANSARIDFAGNIALLRAWHPGPPMGMSRVSRALARPRQSRLQSRKLKPAICNVVASQPSQRCNRAT